MKTRETEDSLLVLVMGVAALFIIGACMGYGLVKLTGTKVDPQPTTVTPDCPPPINTAYIKDCEFVNGGPCEFRSIYEYQQNVISLTQEINI